VACPEDSRCQIIAVERPRPRDQWVLLALGGPGSQDSHRAITLVTAHPGELRAEQRPDLPGDRCEQLIRRRPTRRQRRDAAQHRLLLGQLTQPRLIGWVTAHHPVRGTGG